MTKKSMPKRRKKPNEEEQYQRFLETAEEVEASKDPKAFEKAFKTVTSSKRK